MGGLGSGRKSKATATCPRAGHARSRVKFERTYGPPGHRRRATAACQRTATARTSSPARCRARSAGTPTARSASGRSSATTARTPRAITSSWPAASRWPATDLYLCEWHLRHALERLLAAQARFRRRGFSGTRPRNTPLTTGGLEQRLRAIRDAIHPRRYALKNRERTNRLLMLMQLHANGDDSEPAYRKAILDWLLANGGRPRGVRRSIIDPLGTQSLR